MWRGHMQRREFIKIIGAAVSTLSPAARAEPPSTRRVGVLFPLKEDDPRAQASVAAFRERLQQLGWTDGHNIRIDIRWASGGSAEVQKSAAALAAQIPDVVVVVSAAAAGPMLQATRSIPVVFVNVADPVGAGFVQSLARPGGNATGFTSFDYSMSGKWLVLLKQIAPSLTRVGVIRDPSVTTGIGQFGAIQSVAPSLGLELNSIDIRETGEVETAITSFARTARDGLGLIIAGSASAFVYRNRLIELATKFKLPAIYFERTFAADGGLMSYGPDFSEAHRRAAAYVDRILKGEKPADLPVQTPTKYQLVINLKAAKELGLTVPSSILATADEVIE
jgi:putative tryptophan/tyrosine transport system substrate-binding protein